MDETQLRATSRLPAAIAAVKDSIADAYKALASGLDDAAVRARWQESHGALLIVAHPALICVSDEMGNLIAYGMDARVASPQIVATLNDAAAAILAYMDAVAAGAPDRPMRLLPTYRALLQGRGVEQIPILDVFYPDLDTDLPDRPAPIAPDLELLRNRRRRFEAALLKWLQNPEDRATLDDMRTAVETVEMSRPTKESRAPWCAALATIEALSAGRLDPDVELRRFLAQVNMQIGRAIDGSGEFPPALFRQALYFIARAQPDEGQTTGLLAQMKVAFGLDGIFDSDRSTASDASVIPDRVATALKRLNETWAAWAAGQTPADALRTEVDNVERAATMLPNGAPAELLAEIHSAMRAQAAAGEPDPAAAVEISCALLMIENVIEDAPRAMGSFAQRSANVRARLRACQGDPATLHRLPPMELLDAQARRQEVKVLLSHTLAQAEAAISQAVSALAAFFADASTRNALAGVDKSLAQCAGMFSILQDEPAAAAITVCREEISELANASEDDTTIRDRLARRLTALGEYVAASREAPANLNALLARAGLSTPELPKPRTLQAAPTVQASAEVLDEEMLEVFLEEAVEVLATVESTLPSSIQDPANLEHLTSLRRAFHTLKGSGRMVGLTDLGEAAWQIEQVFNKLVQDELPGTADLFRLVALAHESFARWVGELRTQGKATIDAAELSEWARRIRAGEALPPVTSTPIAPAAPDVAADMSAPSSITIGDIRISPLLYRIFIGEARQHSAVLTNYRQRLLNEPTAASEPAFLRAAHTLCGISATVGLAPMSELASSLECTLLRAAKLSEPMQPSALDELVNAVDRLAEMVACIADQRLPQAQPSLIEALNKIAMPPPIDTPRSHPAMGSFAPPVTIAPSEPPEPFVERRIKRLDDDIDRDLLTIFLTEAQELLPQIGQDLRDWRTRREDKLLPQSLQRLLHTLKGTSRMAGAMALGELTHRMETRVENASRLTVVPETLHDELDASYDRLNELVDHLQRLDGQPLSDSQKLPPVDSLSQPIAAVTWTGELRPVPLTTGAQAAVQEGASPATLSPLVATGPIAPTTDTRLAASPQNVAQAATGGPAPRAVLRVRAESADRLANQAGEVAIARARAETELRGIRGAMRDLTENIIRLRGQLREVEVQAEMQMQSRIAEAEQTNERFDPLEFDRFTRLQELTRLMAESVNDVATVQQNLMRNLEEGEAALGAQARTTRELQDDLVRIRMAPFSSLNDRLYRVARVASRDVGKRVQLDIRGAQAELDRGVLDRIVAPLEHLLRNSIAHGIEPETVRKTAGKPELGTVTIEVRQEGNEVVLGIADDGAGLDIPRIRSQAVAKGLIRQDEELSERQIADFIFRSGFSTAENVSQIAGRGVGMDVVRNEISGLGGRIEMDFERGKGTRFTIYLSLTLAVLKAVVIRAGEELYTVPSLLVEQVQSLKPDQLTNAYAAREVMWRDVRYPMHYLGHLLGRVHSTPSQQRYNPVLLLRSGPHRAAIHVDQLLGGQEIVVKNIGPQLARVPGVTGAAVLPGGETVLILNPVPLAQRAALARTEPQPSVGSASTAQATTARPVAASAVAVPAVAGASAQQATVLVVDDSLTVRKITSRTLSREGYNVVVAKDGIDALEKMQARTPDVIVTDIEMPRMDGFDLTRNVRADPRLKDLPVIMITSRSADKHRQHAAELGVTIFLGKPYEERELLQNIAGVVRAAA